MTSSRPEVDTSDNPSPEPSAERVVNRPSMERWPIEPMDPQIKSIQPGGGLVMQIELLWGRWRRWYLRTFHRGYVERMKAARQGDVSACPHEVIDARDLKFYRNVSDCCWPSERDCYAWRDRIPFARPGFAELILFGGICLALTIVLAFVFWPAAIIPAVLGLFVLWFFRNPRRVIPAEPGLIVSPADGKVVAIDEIENDEFVGGPAVVIGIFLSVFNVHVNRSPVEARVIGLSYRRGKFLNALRVASARENEQLAVRLEENYPPYRRMIVRQIAGAIARRIVCTIKPGDQVSRGELFGMIKFGSRTELVLPREPGLRIDVKIGDTVCGGSSILAHYEDASK